MTMRYGYKVYGGVENADYLHYFAPGEVAGLDEAIAAAIAHCPYSHTPVQERIASSPLCMYVSFIANDHGVSRLNNSHPQYFASLRWTDGRWERQ